MASSDVMQSETSRTEPLTGRGSRPATKLVLAGCGLTGVSLLYLAVADLPSHWGTPRWDLNKMGSWWVVSLFYIFLMLVAFGCYLLAWRVCGSLRPTRARLLLVCVVPLVVSIALSLTYPSFSNDVFYSITSGRILSEYEQNPYAVPPARFANDPFLPYTDWRHLTMPYGPLWTLLGGLVCRAAGDGIVANVLAFKAIAIAGMAISTLMLGLILWQLQPQRLLAGLVLWSWNPLVLLETAGNAHNSIMMIAFTMLGLWLALRGRRAASALALTLAIALKYAAIVLLPLVLVYLVKDHRDWRRKIRLLLPAVLLSAATLAALFAPFWAGWQTLGFVAESNVYFGSPLAIGKMLLEEAGHGEADWALQLLALLVTGLVYPLLLRDATNDEHGFLRACYGAVLLTIVLWPFFAPWYVLWLVLIAAAIASPGVTRQVILVSVVAATTYLFQFSFRRVIHMPVNFWSALTAVSVFGTLAFAILLPRARQLGMRPGTKLRSPNQAPQ